jgi:diguanylate cyclase (GGDEF)-like protein
MNSLYFVSDRLEKYEAYLKRASRDFPFFSFSFKEFLEYHKADAKEPYLENDLVIISKEYLDDARHAIEKSNLRKMTGIPAPHFLYISTNKELESRSIDIVFDENDFFYLLSPEEKKSNTLAINHFYIRLLFKCIENRKRVHDYIVCSFQTIVESTIINNQKREIEHLYSELKELSRIDSLTGVLNRRSFFEALENERKRVLTELRRLHTIEADSGDALALHPGFSRIIGYYGRFSCIMIDIDNFKKVNDNYGHAMGDDVLRDFGRLLKSKLYENDIIGRYGGEEFAALLPETSSISARIPAERLREAVKKLEFAHNHSNFGITVSIGISDFHTDDERYDDIINRADKALYRAKQCGKDCVKIYEELSDT